MTGSTFDPRPRISGPFVAAYPEAVPALPDETIEAGSYVIRFARTADDLDQVLRLRYRIFNLELGEGLDASHLSGRDEDELDARFHHLMICTRRDGAVVGTYRMQTAEMAEETGYYSEQEFDLAGFAPETLAGAVEVGRACVAQPHRNGRVLHLLWRGVARYVTWNRKRRVFGCCSVTSQDPRVGAALHEHLMARGVVDPGTPVRPREGYECVAASGAGRLDTPPHVPALFDAYLALGARVAGPPAVDRLFKTIDWLVMLDIDAMNPAAYRTIFR